MKFGLSHPDQLLLSESFVMDCTICIRLSSRNSAEVQLGRAALVGKTRDFNMISSIL